MTTAPPTSRRQRSVQAASLFGALALSFSLVSHFWPHEQLHITRTLWYVAVAVGALAFAWPVGRLARTGLRAWAVETPAGRWQAVAACVGFGVLLNCGASYRFVLWGDNLWLQAPPVAAVLRPVLWVCDAAILTTLLGVLLTVGCPPRPASPGPDLGPLLRGRRWGHLAVAAGALAWVNVAVCQFVAHERTAHYWDYAGYWLTCTRLAETLADSPAAAGRQFFESFGANDYNDFPALAPSLVMLAAGDSRLAYALAVGNLYGGAVALAAVFAVAAVLRGPGRAVGPAESALVAALAVTFPLVWDPTFRGYLDLGGVALTLVALATYLRRPAAELRWPDVLALGVTLAAAILFRRWYSFWVIAFLAVALAEATLAAARSRAFRLDDWRPAVVAGGVAFFLFASFAWPTLNRVASSDYADLYAGYRSTDDIWRRLDSLAREIGHGYLAAYAVAASVAVARPETRRAALFATAMLPLMLAHFYSVQDMGPHHRLILAPSFLLVVGLALAGGLRAPRAVRAAGGVAALALMVTGFALSFTPQFNLTRAASEPWVTRLPAYPEVRDDTDELVALADDAERECAARDATFVVLASSVVFNQTHVMTVRQSLNLPRTRPSRQLGLSEVDKVTGFPNTFFLSRVVVAADPPQTHLRDGEQVIVRTLAREVLAGTGLGAAFDRLPRVYRLKGGVRAQLFVRRRPFTAAEVGTLRDTLRAAHPGKPSVSEPGPDAAP